MVYLSLLTHFNFPSGWPSSLQVLVKYSLIRVIPYENPWPMTYPCRFRSMQSFDLKHSCLYIQEGYMEPFTSTQVSYHSQLFFVSGESNRRYQIWYHLKPHQGSITEGPSDMNRVSPSSAFAQRSTDGVHVGALERGRERPSSACVQTVPKANLWKLQLNSQGLQKPGTKQVRIQQ